VSLWDGSMPRRSRSNWWRRMSYSAAWTDWSRLNSFLSFGFVSASVLRLVVRGKVGVTCGLLTFELRGPNLLL
jgi:hypothetical protein